MKIILLVLSAVIFFSSCVVNEQPQSSKFITVEEYKKNNETLDKTYESAEFPGGIESLMEFLKENIKYPEEALVGGVQGVVMVTFIVEIDGSLSNIKVKDIGAGCGRETIRVVKMMPKWKPAKSKGQPVRQGFELPVRFNRPANRR